MTGYIKRIEKSLSAEKIDILKHIFKPTVVKTPLEDSRKDICILKDGEIRSYGSIYKLRHDKSKERKAYLSSKDAGLSWEFKYAKGIMHSSTYLEKPDLYIRIKDKSWFEESEKGLFVYRSKIGPDDENPEKIKISDDDYYSEAYLPQKSAFSDRIWFTAEKFENARFIATFFFSDDFGLTWEKRDVLSPAFFDVKFPHKGKRWQQISGAEPYAVETGENQLMMILRTPTDNFYMSYSDDGGNTWTESVPSTFYGTNTTAFMLRLQDGRILNFWNNTKPLPEVDHTKTIPPSAKTEIDGLDEDAFTNRDAAHCAISSDGGKTFKGYREILLNPARNRSDFRYFGGAESSPDKSVHQFQAFELPFNKVLVSVGQNQASRRLIIFDIDWLLEENAEENFLSGVENITTHTYLKSVSGCHVQDVGNGHCAWNRTYSAYPMPDPDGGYGECLYIKKGNDPCLINNIGGACWNFPMSKKGRVTAEIKIIEKQAKFILTDRWYNTCDEYAYLTSPFNFLVDIKDTGREFVKVSADFDTENGECHVYINDEHYSDIKMTNPCPTGISYLILQCDTDGESDGFYIKSLSKTGAKL